VWSGQGTVLLVDDEADVREVVQEILEAAGYRVITARNGREALEVFEARRRHVDCVLLDLTMPQMDGVEAYRELRRLDPELRILLTSGYASPDVDPRIAALEACRFLAKPFTAAGLLEAVQTTLGRGRPGGVERRP
jgi:CheY-like chemotaxis protein